MSHHGVVERLDVFVIGGGGTGSEIAFRLGRHGLRVAIAERDRLGGECNHWGCVPTKVMLRSAKIAALARDAGRFGVRIPSVGIDLPAIQRRARDVINAQSGDGAVPFERIGVTVYQQDARLVGPRRLELADGTQIEAERVVLATGSEATLPPVDGLSNGPYWTNREAIWEPTEPPGSLAILGAGAIGIEFAQIYSRLGTDVILLEALPHIAPNEDEDVSREIAAALAEEGVDVRADTAVTRVAHADGTWTLALDGGDEVRADRVLVATGRTPVFDGQDLEAVGVELDERRRPVLSETLRTTADGIWVAGDATGELLFTHVGTYEAGIVVDDVLGRPHPKDYRVVPRVTYSDPEIASVGLTEQQAIDEGRDVAAVSLTMRENERAHIEGSTHGVVKLVADRSTGELLGGHVVAEEAGAMIHQIVTAMTWQVPARALGDAIHAYPTLSESVKGAFEQLADRLE